MRLHSVAALCLFLSACASTSLSDLRHVSQVEIPDYLAIVSARASGSYTSYWLQPGNRSEECKILMESYRFPGERDERPTPAQVAWDGGCLNGKAHGLGKTTVNAGSVEWYEIAFHNEGITDRHYYRGIVGADRVQYGMYVRESEKMTRCMFADALLGADGSPTTVFNHVETDLANRVSHGMWWIGTERRIGIIWDENFFGERSIFDAGSQSPSWSFAGLLNLKTARPAAYGAYSDSQGLRYQHYVNGVPRENVMLPQSYLDAITAAYDEGRAAAHRAASAAQLALIMKKNYDAAARVAPAVETIEREEPRRRSTGTGFFVSDDGYLLTNSHVVADASTFSVFLGDKRFTARLVEDDPRNDIALLKVDARVQALPLDVKNRTKLGTEVTVLGYPNVQMQGPSQKATFGQVNSESGVNGDARHLQFSAPIQPGNSGSPMLNEHGAVVGIVFSTLNQSAALERTGALAQSVNYAIKVTYALPLLIGNDVKYRSASGRAGYSKTELVERSFPGVVLIVAE